MLFYYTLIFSQAFFNFLPFLSCLEPGLPWTMLSTYSLTLHLFSSNTWRCFLITLSMLPHLMHTFFHILCILLPHQQHHHIFTFSALTLFFLSLTACLHTHVFRSCAASLLLSSKSCAAYFFILMSWSNSSFFILMSFASSFLVPWILLSSSPLLCLLRWTLLSSRDIFWHFYVLCSLNLSVSRDIFWHQFVPPNCTPRFLMLVSFVFLAVSPFLFINTSRQTIFAWTVCVSVWACTSFLFPSSFRVLLLCKWDHQAFLHRFFFPMFLFLFVTVFSECTVFSPCDVWLLQCMHWTLPSQIIQ